MGITFFNIRLYKPDKITWAFVDGVVTLLVLVVAVVGGFGVANVLVVLSADQVIRDSSPVEIIQWFSLKTKISQFYVD